MPDRQWPQNFDAVRTAAEARLGKSADRLTRWARQRLIDALDQFGSVEAIPQAVWDDIEREAVFVLFPILHATAVEAANVVLDSLQSSHPIGNVEAGTEQRTRQAAERIGRETASAIRRDLRQANLPPKPPAGMTAPLTLPGIVRPDAPPPTVTPAAYGAMNHEQLRKYALDAIVKATTLDKARVKSIAGQHAAEAIGNGARDGAGIYQAENPHHRVSLIWRVRKADGSNAAGGAFDERVCPICAPLEGLPEHLWAEYVFGVPAHWGCRCEYQVFVTLGRFGGIDVDPGRRR
jgi:hypothetical protein